MKKYIEVKNFTPSPGKEYDPTEYPGKGIFMDTTGRMFAVSSYPGSMSTTVCMIPTVPDVVIIEDKAPQVSTGITTDVLLKAIAVSQQPALIKDLIK